MNTLKNHDAVDSDDEHLKRASFKGGVRGKYAERYREGVTITVTGRQGPQTPLCDVQGLDPASSARLQRAGVSSAEALIETAGSESGLVAVAHLTGIPRETIERWVELAEAALKAS